MSCKLCCAGAGNAGSNPPVTVLKVSAGGGAQAIWQFSAQVTLLDPFACEGLLIDGNFPGEGSDNPMIQGPGPNNLTGEYGDTTPTIINGVTGWTFDPDQVVDGVGVDLHGRVWGPIQSGTCAA